LATASSSLEPSPLSSTPAAGQALVDTFDQDKVCPFFQSLIKVALGTAFALCEVGVGQLV
jgi:hypothetical protein